MTKVFKLSAATLTAIKADVSKDLLAKRAGLKVIDSLVADGITHTMMVAPKKGDDRTFYASLEAAVVAGFTASAQAMLSADVKTLAEIDEAKAKANRDAKCKINRRYWQQQVGSKIKDYRNAVEKRNAPADEGGAGANKASWESVKRKVIAEIITQAQGKEASTIKDMAGFIKDLQSALVRIPANA
jgi:hypothetical protein